MNLPPYAEPDPNSDNPVVRARGEINDFLARFYHELGVYAVAAALDVPVEDEWLEESAALAAIRPPVGRAA